MKQSVQQKLVYVAYAMLLLGLIFFVARCGEQGAEIEKKLLKPFATGEDGDGLTGGIRFTGTLESVNVGELAIIAPEGSSDDPDSAFSGQIMKDPEIELTIIVESSGVIEKGQLKMTVHDRPGNNQNSVFSYYSDCSKEKNRLCGTFKNQRLNINLFDNGGHVSFVSDKPLKNQELSGAVKIDNRGTELGKFVIRTEQSLDKVAPEKEKTQKSKIETEVTN